MMGFCAIWTEVPCEIHMWAEQAAQDTVQKVTRSRWFYMQTCGEEGGGSGGREGADEMAGVAEDVRSHALSRPVKGMAREQMRLKSEREGGNYWGHLFSPLRLVRRRLNF